MNTHAQNQFLGTREMYGREENYLDFEAFGRAIARAVGGKVVAEEAGMWGSSRVKVGDLTLYFGRSRQSGGKWIVHVGSGCPEIETNIHYSERGKFPSANVDSARPVETLAKDIQRRVIEPAQSSLVALKAKFQKQNDTHAQLKARVAELKAAFPGFEANLENEQASQAAIWGSNAGHYLTGTLYPDGAISIQHIGSLSPSHARKVLKVLFSEKAKED